MPDICTKCWGSGEIKDPVLHTKRPCLECKGSGFLNEPILEKEDIRNTGMFLEMPDWSLL